MTVRIYQNLPAVPLFSEDLEAEDGNPESVVRLCREAARADGLLLATPEYNGSFSGVLKNAIDWLSRPPARLLREKPVAVMGATPGTSGTRSAQSALRHVLDSTRSRVLPAPALHLSDVGSAFDDTGCLKDSETRQTLQRLLSEFANWIEPTSGGNGESGPGSAGR